MLSSAFGYFVEERLNVTIDEETESVKGQYVSGDYFRGMGVPPPAGRLILPADDESGAAAVAVLSHRFSQRRFGDARLAVGRTIRINDKPVSVVGVTTPEFFGAEPGSVPDLYVPMRAEIVLNPASAAGVARTHLGLELLLDRGHGPARARAWAPLRPRPSWRRSSGVLPEDSATTEKARADLPELRIMQGAAGLDSLRRRYAKPLYVLMAMVGSDPADCVRQRREPAAGAGDGAAARDRRAAQHRRQPHARHSTAADRKRRAVVDRWRARPGCSPGGASASSRLLLANGRENFTLHAELNWNVLAVTLVLSVLTGLVFGLAPAIQATRVDLMPALKEIRPGALAGTAGRARLA